MIIREPIDFVRRAAAGVSPVPNVPNSGLAMLNLRRAMFGSNRKRLSRSASVASALFVVLFIAALVVAPMLRPRIVTVELPDRTVAILPEPIPEPPPREAAERPALEQVAMRQIADPPALPEHLKLPAPRIQHNEPDTDAERAGAERARQVTAELASSTGALDRALRDLSASLRGAGAYEPSRRASRTRSVRGGRSDGDLPAASTGAASAGSADLKGSTVEGSMVAIGSLAPAPSSGAAQADDATGSASAPGVYRTNASLMAVIRRYAAGIQYCYDGELKRDPSLRGKIVVAITVAASGAVTDARVVQNTIGSPALVGCALGQIRDWRFPTIPSGVTTFQAPFVFTPPN